MAFSVTPLAFYAITPNSGRPIFMTVAESLYDSGRIVFGTQHNQDTRTMDGMTIKPKASRNIVIITK